MYLSGTSNTFRANRELVHALCMKGRDETAYPWNRDCMYQDWRVKSAAEIDCFRQRHRAAQARCRSVNRRRR